MTLKFYDDGSGNSYTAMGVPSQLTTSAVTSNSADLTLPAGVTGAQYYELSESTDNGASWTVVDSAIAPSSIVSPATYSRSGLTSGVTYQWRLRARFASLVSPAYSAVHSAVIQASVTAPAAPVLGTPTVTSSSVTAVVTNGNGAASFESRVSYDGGSTYSTPVSGLTVTGISASTSGILEVRGLTSGGVAGAWSSTASFTTSALQANGSVFTDSFSSGAVKLNDPSGFYWAQGGTGLPSTNVPLSKATSSTYTIGVLPAPHANKNGVVLTYPAQAWGNGYPPQINFQTGQNNFEVWHRFSLFIPSNYKHRSIVGCNVSSALGAPNWNVGDTVNSVQGASDSGQITGFDTNNNRLWIENITNHASDSYWGAGTITNATTGATASVVSRTGQSTNHKFIIVWQGGYSSNGMGYELDVERYADSSAPIDSSMMNVNVTATDTTPYSPRHLSNSDGTIARLIDPTTDKGKLIQFTMHSRKSTSSTSYDGVIQMWKKNITDGGALQLILSNNTEVLSWDSAANYFDRGYILGAANGGFREQTTFYFTDYEFWGANAPSDIPSGSIV